MVLPPYPLTRSLRSGNILVGDGVTTIWGPFAYDIADADDVTVYRKDVGEQSFTPETGAVITKSSGEAFDTFTITISPALPLTTQWYHLGTRLHERSLAVTKGTQIDPDALDKELTKQALVLQELRRDVNQSIKTDPGTTAPAIASPLTAGALLQYDAFGNIVSSPVTEDAIEQAAADAAAAAASADQAEAALQAFFNEVDSQYVIKLKTTTTNGVLEYALTGSMPAVNGHLHVNVLLNNVFQPKDGIAYTITDAGTKILLASNPGVTSLYVEGAAIYTAYDTDSSLASLVANDSGVAGATVKNALETLNAKTYAATQITNNSAVAGANVANALNTLDAKVYTASQVTNNSAVAGATVKAALETLNAKVYTATQVTNSSAVSGATVKDALDTLGGIVGDFAVWPSSVNRTLKDRSKFLCHVMDFDVDPTGGNDSTAGLLAWNAQAQAAKVPGIVGNDGNGIGDFMLGQELEITRPGHLMRFESTGGYSYNPDNPGGWWVGNGRFRIFGTWFDGAVGSRVRTRRLHRANSGSPQDEAMSCAINVQAQGVRLENVGLILDDNYAVSLPVAYGSVVDIGIFVGCRVGVQIIRPRIIGHFRKAGIYFDVTHQAALPRHYSIAGASYPDYGELSCADYCSVIDPVIRGSWHAISIRGAKPKAGATDYGDPYYDYITGTTNTDGRGAAGFSDFRCEAGQLSSVDHRSGRRAYDAVLTTGGVMNLTNLQNTGENAPAIVYIDGLASNGSLALWNMSFSRTRFVTTEAFRVRLGRASRVTFDNCHFDGGGNAYNMAGTDLGTSNQYTTVTWGDIASDQFASRIKVLGTPHSSLITGGIAPHYYGDKDTFHAETAAGDIYAASFTTPGNLDLASGVGSTMPLNTPPGPAIILRNGTATAFRINYHVDGAYGTTTASSANMYIAGSNIIYRSTSSGDFKADVEDLSDDARDIIMQLRPVWYRSLCEADNPAWSYYGFIAEEVAAVDPRLVHFKTEENVMETQLVRELQPFMETDENGETREVWRLAEVPKDVEVLRKLDTPKPSGLQYERLTVHLVAKAQQQERRLAALESRLAALEGNG